jgi:hypothetical protein
MMLSIVLMRLASVRRKRSQATSPRRSPLRRLILLRLARNIRPRLRRQSRMVREGRSTRAARETTEAETRVETVAMTVRRKRLREKVKHKQDYGKG